MKPLSNKEFKWCSYGQHEAIVDTKTPQRKGRPFICCTCYQRREAGRQQLKTRTLSGGELR